MEFRLMYQAVHIKCLFDLSQFIVSSFSKLLVYDRRWVSHRNEAKAFDGFIKIDNIEKNKNLFLNKGMTIRKIYVTEKKNYNRRNNAKKRKNAKWRNNAKKAQYCE